MQATATPTPSAPPPPAASSAAEMYQALRAQRRELNQQLDQLEGRREDISREIVQGTEGAGKARLEARMAEIDRRIADVETQIAANEKAIATAAAVPGAVVEPRPIPRTGPPEEAIVTAVVFTGIAGVILAFAFARRIWRKSAAIVPSLPPELWQRLTRLEQAVDSVAMEVERIGEGQRFTNKLFAEGRSIGAGSAQPLDARVGEPLPLRRDER